MTKELEAFLDEIIADLKKFESEKDQANLDDFIRSKYDIYIEEEEINFINNMMVEWKGFKDIFEWSDSINEELFERSETCFQDILILQEMYQKEQKVYQRYCIDYLLEILIDLKKKEWIREKIGSSDVDFRELLLDCCSLKLTAIKEIMSILYSIRKNYEIEKVAFFPIFALEYWIYDHLQIEIKMFLEDYFLNTRKQKLFPSRDESFFKSEPKGINEYYSNDEIEKLLKDKKEKKLIVGIISQKEDITKKKAFKLVKEKADELGIPYYSNINSYYNS